MAMAERHLADRFGDDLVDHRTWVIAGDGCLMEGISHEAISLAGRLKLSKLTVLWDDNHITIDGDAAIAETGDQLARFKAAGWAVKRIDGHDFGQIKRPCLGAPPEAADPDRLPHQDRQGRGHQGRHHDTHGTALGEERDRRHPREAGLGATRPSSPGASC